MSIPHQIRLNKFLISMVKKIGISFKAEKKKQLSSDMRFSTMWYVRKAKALTSLCIHAV